ADLARRLARSGDLETAVELYRRALAARFNQVDWRLALIDVLTRLERYEEAHHEARICLRVRPQSDAARKRFETLSRKLPVE
ncbi:MAG: tetratricopeptide repeat protein, partial [Planctomycetota bacterium]